MQREPITLPCPHCATVAVVTQVQGDRCPGCDFEFTLFEPGQELVARRFFEVLTGSKYECDVRGGQKIIVHG